MKVFVTSKREFDSHMKRMGITEDNVERQTKTFFISINCTRGTDEVPYFKEGKSNVMVLFFDDIEEDLADPKWGLIKAFSIEQERPVAIH